VLTLRLIIDFFVCVPKLLDISGFIREDNKKDNARDFISKTSSGRIEILLIAER